MRLPAAQILVERGKKAFFLIARDLQRFAVDYHRKLLYRGDISKIDQEAPVTQRKRHIGKRDAHVLQLVVCGIVSFRRVVDDGVMLDFHILDVGRAQAALVVALG